MLFFVPEKCDVFEILRQTNTAKDPPPPENTYPSWGGLLNAVERYSPSFISQKNNLLIFHRISTLLNMKNKVDSKEKEYFISCENMHEGCLKQTVVGFFLGYVTILRYNGLWIYIVNTPQ